MRQEGPASSWECPGVRVCPGGKEEGGERGRAGEGAALVLSAVRWCPMSACGVASKTDTRNFQQVRLYLHVKSRPAAGVRAARVCASLKSAPREGVGRQRPRFRGSPRF